MKQNLWLHLSKDAGHSMSLLEEHAHYDTVLGGGDGKVINGHRLSNLKVKIWDMNPFSQSLEICNGGSPRQWVLFYDAFLSNSTNWKHLNFHLPGVLCFWHLLLKWMWVPPCDLVSTLSCWEALSVLCHVVVSLFLVRKLLSPRKPAS